MKNMLMLVTIVFALVSIHPALARSTDPAPPATSPENAIYQPDVDLPFNPDGRVQRARPDRIPLTPVDKQGRSDEIGGDDSLVAEYNFGYHGQDFAIDSDGIMYSIGTVAEVDQNIGFDIRRSTDGGETWIHWATFEDPDPYNDFTDPSLHIAEGNQDRLFLAFTYRELGNYHVKIAWSPLGDTPSFTVTTLHSTYDWAGSVSVTSDASAYSQFYLYMAYSIQEGDSSEIFFTRSTDYGATWETPYSIASLNMSDRSYYGPRVSYGYGQYVHVAWTFSIDAEGYDNAVRYRRAPTFASGGQAAWDPIKGPSSAVDGIHDYVTTIAASASTDQVLIAYDRFEPGSWFDYSAVVASEDQGASWESPHILDHGLFYFDGLEQHPTTLNWYAAGTWFGDTGIMWAPASDLTDWSDHLALSDESQNYSAEMVLDPTHDHRPAVIWYHSGEPSSYVFDAEWRGDEGFPNHEEGFPVDLGSQPISDPALADLNGDGNQEIIFGDNYGFVQVYRANGTPLPGWPRYTGTSLSDSPIAVADMDGNGTPIILAPSVDGRVFGYNPDGSQAQGWPFDSGEDALASVNIGNLGPPYPYVAVVIAGTKMHFLGPRGNQVPGSHVWTNNSFLRGCAIGDHDGDGVNEVIFRSGQLLLATEMTAAYTDLYRGLGNDQSSVPSLGDLDLDGNLEVVVTTPGNVFVIDDDGSDFPGWPQSFDPNIPLSDAAIAHVWAGFEREVAVCSRNWKAAMFQHDGNLVPGYPVETDGWYIYGNPVLGPAAGSPDMIFGARGSKAWAFSNYGSLTEGWPKVLNNHCTLSPAIGDMDQDGRNEIVFLTSDQLVVVDVGSSPWASIHNWPMTGHDPRRTGCADCPEDLITPVPDDENTVTRVSFAAPSPNPVSSSATFSYAVPVQAVVELSVYDLRGRRVALIHREEVIPGHHQITWNGRDDQGRSLASGNYVASLRVRGPGLNDQLNRKVTILR